MTKAKNTLLGLLSGWLKKEKQQKQLENMVNKLSPDDLGKIGKLLKKCSEDPTEKDSRTMKAYLNWHKQEKQKRLDLLDVVAPSSGPQKKHHDELRLTIALEGRPLTQKEIDTVFSSDDEMFKYFSSLSLSQLQTYREAFEKGDIAAPAQIRKAMLQLLTFFEEERTAYEKDWLKNIAPQAKSLLRIEETQGYLDQLVQIQKELASSSSAK